MTIYIDIIIIENLIMNYIIIYATSIVSKVKIKKYRIIIASTLGAIYSIMSYIINISLYSNLIIKILLSVVMIHISFKPQSFKKMIKILLMFYLVTFVFGGIVLSLLYFIKPQDIITNNGFLIGTYPIKIVFLGAIMGLVMLIIFGKEIKSRFSKASIIFNAIITINGKKIEEKAMLDTGNMLKEPITNTPVIIVERSALYDILPKEILNNLENILKGNIEIIPNEVREKYICRIKILPFTSLGKENGMLVGIKADSVIIKNDEMEKNISPIIVGIYDKSLTKRGEYRALIGLMCQ